MNRKELFVFGFIDDSFPTDLPENSFEPNSPQMELLMETHRASRLLQRLQIHKGRNLHHDDMPDFEQLKKAQKPDAAKSVRRAFGSMRGQGRLLHFLAKQDGVFIKDIVMAFDIRPSSASELVAKLEKQGLVRVENDSDDKRVRKVFLTEQGKELIDTMESMFEDHTNELLTSLSTEEQSQLLALLKKLNAGLAEQSADLGKDFSKGHGPLPPKGFDKHDECLNREHHPRVGRPPNRAPEGWGAGRGNRSTERGHRAEGHGSRGEDHGGRGENRGNPGEEQSSRNENRPVD
ncbi:MAG: MarR family winged helix-turn-helix transcriptional regulator [Coriobacteriales bacterium]|jgi:DNA-binding MarR family transcriptional regulator|nr:MarR family winged helix-turn-helix transcriptional regulator [Coriobacteriales bacterium]